MKNLVIVISSNNKNKLREYKEIFEPYKNVIIKSLSEMNIDVDPIENGNTFQENSLIKANAVTNLTDEYVIADDSGLEILALDNFPGIHSSRFMKGHTYQEKCQAIFDMLKDKKRDAQFHCVITLAKHKEKPIFFEGIVPGHISDIFTGTSGFGYDPIFIPDAFTKTYAELGEEEKNKISHRAKASEKLIDYLKTNKLI